MGTSSGIEWERFSQDPRRAEVAGIRASDGDRAVALDAIGDAYADGRLDRAELDDRTVRITSAKTFGDLLPPLRDLAADQVPALRSPARIQQDAESYYRHKRSEALLAFVGPSLICWVIYAANFESTKFPWPLFVSFGTLLNILRVLVGKGSIIHERRTELEEREEERLEKERRRALDPGKDADGQQPG